MTDKGRSLPKQCKSTKTTKWICLAETKTQGDPSWDYKLMLILSNVMRSTRLATLCCLTAQEEQHHCMVTHQSDSRTSNQWLSCHRCNTTTCLQTTREHLSWWFPTAQASGTSQTSTESSTSSWLPMLMLMIRRKVSKTRSALCTCHRWKLSFRDPSRSDQFSRLQKESWTRTLYMKRAFQHKLWKTVSSSSPNSLTWMLQTVCNKNEWRKYLVKTDFVFYTLRS